MSPNIFELIQQFCPNGVEYRRLGDVLKSLNTGLNPRSFFKLNTSDSNNYYVTIREMRNNTIVFSDVTDRIDDKALQLCNNRSNLEVGDVLFSGTGTIGEVALISEIPFNWNIKEGIYALKPDIRVIASKFLMQLLMSNPVKIQVRCRIFGGTVKSISMIDLRKIFIPVPPLPVQQEIVRILDTFDTYRNDVTAGLAGELAMRRKQFQYWQKKLLSFDDSVPRKALGEVGVLIKGMSSVTSKWCDTGNCRFIDYKNVYDHRFVDVSDLPLATVKNKERQTVLQVGDVLFTSASEVVDECAISSVVRDDISPNVLLDDHLFGIRLCDQTVLDPVFLNYYCQTEFFRASVRRVVRGVTRFYVGLKDFERIAIPIPPLSVQQEIVRVLDVFVELERELERELELRAKQFEYYRDHLLAFPEKKGA